MRRSQNFHDVADSSNFIIGMISVLEFKRWNLIEQSALWPTLLDGDELLQDFVFAYSACSLNSSRRAEKNHAKELLDGP